LGININTSPDFFSVESLVLEWQATVCSSHAQGASSKKKKERKKSKSAQMMQHDQGH
jgi:hypothetical protein